MKGNGIAQFDRDSFSGKVGAIVGSGRFPLIWLDAVKGQIAGGYDGVVAVAITDEGYDSFADKVNTTRVSMGQAGKIAKTLLDGGATNVSLIGKVEKSSLLKGIKLDAAGVKILGRVSNYNDISVLESIVKYLEGKGLEVLAQDVWLSHLLVEEGVYTKKKPDKAATAEIQYGLKMARSIANLEIGQTVITRKKSVLAVESVEGTDAAIKRGGELAYGKGAIVAKVLKPGQDRRFDIPTIGLRTVTGMAESGIKTLAIEAGSTFFMERQEALEFADKNKMIITALSSDEIDRL